MRTYKPRKIKFDERLETHGWTIKTYTITKHGEFNHPDVYTNAKAQLPA